MEENFKDVIEEIKKSCLDEEKTKKYILAIKKIVQKLYDGCKDDEDEEEILRVYLEEYEDDLKFRGNAKKIFNQMLMYGAYKRILADFKGNRFNFDSVLREAKKRENENKREALAVKADVKESMISAIRYIIRTHKITKEKEILEVVQQNKAKLSNNLKPKMIDIIQTSISLLNEYGFIDEYIESSNAELRQIGLGQLQYEKRNPIADKQYDENGELVTDVEDVGVIDTFSKDNLEKMSLEDLEIMTAFWESKYLQERMGLSKAMSVINTLDLWHDLMHEDDSVVKELNEDKINSALKKDLALTYLCRKDCVITGRMKMQYKKFLEQENLNSNTELSEEVNAILPEISNLKGAAEDVSILECLMIYQLLSKELKIKRWGIIERVNNDNFTNSLVIAIENRNFRGPLIMEVPESILQDIFENSLSEIPKYEKKLNEEYCNVMSKLYLPTNNYFNNLMKKAYKENPESQLLADLAGKKVKSGEER